MVGTSPWTAWLRTSRENVGSRRFFNRRNQQSGGRCGARRSTGRFLLLCLFLTGSAHAASSLDVDRRTMRAGSTITVTLILEGEIAKVNAVELPATNLFLGEPSLATEFSWVNGTTTRRKIFRWTATSQSSGSASIGPLTLRGEDGALARFAAIPLTIVEAPTPPANEREAIARLDSEEPVVVVAELDRATAFVGEQRVVSWWVYSRSAIRSVRVSGRPTFADFWVEEIPLDEQAEPETSSAGYGVTRYLVRRTAIYPVRSGELEIPSLGVTAAVMEAIESPFDRFGLNRRIVETRADSQALRIAVSLPPPATAIVGTNVTMRCSRPVAPQSGPLFFDVTLAGDANLRTAETPVADGLLPGRIDWSALGSVSRPSGDRVQMTRGWRASIYPDRSGALTIPRFTLQVYKPGIGTQTLACEATTIQAQAVSLPPTSGNRSEVPVRAQSRSWRFPAAIAGLLIFAAFISIVLVREGRKRRLTESKMLADLYDADPLAMRHKVDLMLESRGFSRSELLAGSTELAEDYRSIEAAIDMRTRESWRREELDGQVREQLARFIATLQN